jgi:aminopeptidase N
MLSSFVAPRPVSALAVRWLCSLLAAVAVAATAATPEEGARFDFDRTRTVLPKSVVPSHYRLALELDPLRPVFDGRVIADVVAREPVPHIVLHAHGLQAGPAWLDDGGARRALDVKADPRSQTWRLTPRDGRPVAAGAHRLHLSYRGRVQRTGEGLFRVDHRSNGRPATMLATQLQAVQARTVFPHWDEPLFRAAFEIEVTAPAGYTVLSNQPQVEAQARGGRVWHRFAATPPMPSYLVSVAVGRFDVLEGEADGVPLRLFTAPGKREQARYALEVTRQVLPYFNTYFGVRYALPKLDQIAVPGTRDGAMEDWGLISYIENALLYDPARSDPATQRAVFDTVAHEIAHQWFGNLVSVASWDETCLNEAFATWMAAKATERFHPEWQSRLTGRTWVDRTLDRDATAATRAIRSGPVDEARVFDVFDGITYSKGGAVLSMIEHWVGEEAFQRGLAAYMQERRFAPATAGDLWHHIGQASGRNVAVVAASWTDRPGFPLVESDTRCVDGHTELTLRQRRFAFGAGAEAATTWQVPVRLAQGSRQQTVLLAAPEQRFDWPGCDSAPLVVNAGARGFYRVQYGATQLQALQQGFRQLASEDRNALLVDSAALVLAGRQPLAAHLAWLARLPEVGDAGRAPLFALAATQLQGLDRTLHGTPAQAVLRRFGRSLLGAELARLGWAEAAGEDAEVSRLRGTLVAALARFDAAEVVAEALQRWRAAQHGGPALPPSLRAAIVGAVGRHGGAREFEQLQQALLAADSQEERWLLARALASGRDAARAQRVLELALSDALPSDVALELPALVAQEPAQATRAYAFVVEHWPRLATRAGSGVFGERAWLLPNLVWSMSDAAAAQRLRRDQARLVGPTGRMAADTAAARVEVQASLREREGSRLPGAVDGLRPAGS